MRTFKLIWPSGLVQTITGANLFSAMKENDIPTYILGILVRYEEVEA